MKCYLQNNLQSTRSYNLKPENAFPERSKRSFTPHWDAKTYSRFAAPFYDLATRVTGWQQHLVEYALEGLNEGRLLDVGCGTGIVLGPALAKGLDAVGLDPSEGMLARAGLKLKQTVVLVLASAAELPFDNNSFDIVLATGSLVHVPEIEAAAQEIARIAKPGALIRIIDHAIPLHRSRSTVIAGLFSQLSGDILHDYEEVFSSKAQLQARTTLGRGGYLQRFDFIRTALADSGQKNYSDSYCSEVRSGSR